MDCKNWLNSCCLNAFKCKKNTYQSTFEQWYVKEQSDPEWCWEELEQELARLLAYIGEREEEPWSYPDIHGS